MLVLRFNARGRRTLEVGEENHCVRATAIQTWIALQGCIYAQPVTDSRRCEETQRSLSDVVRKHEVESFM